MQHILVVLTVIGSILFVPVPNHAGQTVGLFQNDPDSFGGYTLLAPQTSTTTYLINEEGKRVHSWSSFRRPGLSAYLLPGGTLLRTGQYAPVGVPRFNTGGNGGRLEEYLWDGTRIWDFPYSDSAKRQHHDIEKLPNGNVLLIAWEYKSSVEAIAAGRNPALLSDGELWPDHIVEVMPSGLTGGEVVWEWHVWDHLVQDHDASKNNYGSVEDHPELIDLNFIELTGPFVGGADWTHVNAVDYNPELDQIVLSVHALSEIWVIDRSTTTEEAAGHTGGLSGKGGDLLYRWGNPQVYRRGEAADRTLFKQHDAQWIETGLSGAGNFLIFNNGSGRPGGNFSSVDEIVPPLDEHGAYYLAPDSAYGPDVVEWTYVAPPPSIFFATNISGAHRLPNGNTIICDGPHGTIFEVTPALDTVWRYVNPINFRGAIPQGEPVTANGVFRAYRYGPDYPAFDGIDLTPGDPLEEYDRPLPVPDGEAATEPLLCSRVTAEGDWLHVEWDARACPAHAYNMIYGDLSGVASFTLQGAQCGIGTVGSYDWNAVPPGDLFFLVVGVDATGVYESSWGPGAFGAERSATSSSWKCGVTTKDAALGCP
jgi:hypothetical protein